jgi:N utilization substance protein B
VVKRDARVVALEVLYAADTRGELPDPADLPGRPARLVAGVGEHLRALDEEIADAASGWRIERMPAVDRNILRLGLYELRYTDTPVGVVISQAVELAKTYSTERSGSFVNGILGTLAEKGPGSLR